MKHTHKRTALLAPGLLVAAGLALTLADTGSPLQPFEQNPASSGERIGVLHAQPIHVSQPASGLATALSDGLRAETRRWVF